MGKPIAAYSLGDTVRVYLLWKLRKPLLIVAALLASSMYRNSDDHPPAPRFQRICTDMDAAGWCRSFDIRRVAAGAKFDHRFGDDQAWCIRFDARDGRCLKMQTTTDEAANPYRHPFSAEHVCHRYGADGQCAGWSRRS